MSSQLNNCYPYSSTLPRPTKEVKTPASRKDLRKKKKEKEKILSMSLLSCWLFPLPT
jgi:hypothetical protein